MSSVVLFLLACVSAVSRVAAYHSGVPSPSSAAIHVPPYTKALDDVDTAVFMLKKHLEVPDNSAHPNDPFVQYLMILDTVHKLVNEVYKGSTYEDIYDHVVDESIESTPNDPSKASNNIRRQMDAANSKIAVVRDLIYQQQMDACRDNPVSQKCDVIVDIAIKASHNPILKSEADFLITLSHVANNFMNNFYLKFYYTSLMKMAVTYLVTGQKHLKPLVESAVEARNKGRSIDTQTAIRSSLFDQIINIDYIPAYKKINIDNIPSFKKNNIDHIPSFNKININHIG